MKIKVVGFDPSMTNWGCCLATVDVNTLEVAIQGLQIYQTESEARKGVIKQSDDLRRAIEVRNGMLKACDGAAFAISEIPFMNPGGYASANFNSGLVTGVLASIEIPLIQVFPRDVKIAAVGHKDACKEEMIEWAITKYPDAPWLTVKRKGKMVPTKANEHLADAVAAIHAGIQTEQFRQALAMFRSMEKVSH